MAKLTKKEIDALNFALSTAQTAVSINPVYNSRREEIQGKLDVAKKAVAKLRK